MGDYRVTRDVTAGCHTCDGLYVTKWTGGNAQGVAARHARAHNHSTWVAVEMSIGYGPRYADTPQGAPQKPEVG
jgi:hypothetical protein